MTSCRGHHSITRILGPILQTIDCLYSQLRGGNSPLGELNALQSEQWCILHPKTSVACAVSTARHVCRRVGWLHSWDLLRTTQCAPWWMRSDRYCGVSSKSSSWHHKPSSAWVFNLLIKLLIQEVPGGCPQGRLGCVLFVNQQNTAYESKKSYPTSWTRKSQELEYIYLVFPPTPPFSVPPILKQRQHSELSQNNMTGT